MLFGSILMSSVVFGICHGKKTMTAGFSVLPGGGAIHGKMKCTTQLSHALFGVAKIGENMVCTSDDPDWTNDKVFTEESYYVVRTKSVTRFDPPLALVFGGSSEYTSYISLPLTNIGSVSYYFSTSDTSLGRIMFAYTSDNGNDLMTCSINYLLKQVMISYSYPSHMRVPIGAMMSLTANTFPFETTDVVKLTFTIIYGQFQASYEIYVNDVMFESVPVNRSPTLGSWKMAMLDSGQAELHELHIKLN